jgi:hypothetical protein
MMTEAKALTRDDILNADDLRIEVVQVPEWGGIVYIRTLTGQQREKYVESIRKVTGQGKKQSVEIILQQSGAKLAAQTICEQGGKPLFTEADIPKLAAKSSKALQRVIDAAAKLNGIDEDAEEDAKNDLASRTVNGDSSIGSLDTSERPASNSFVN